MDFAHQDMIVSAPLLVVFSTTALMASISILAALTTKDRIANPYFFFIEPPRYVCAYVIALPVDSNAMVDYTCEALFTICSLLIN
jgi:hypothetical protein